MKKKLIFLVIIFTSLLAAQNSKFYSNITLDSKYNNNVLRLSQSDLDRYESGYETDKFHLETSDDLITSLKVGLNLKHRIFAGHTQINRFTIKYSKFLKNDLLDNFNIGFTMKQYLSKKINFGIYYNYYPEIYVNRYDSVLDDELIFRDFTYSRNNYIGKLNYSLNDNYHFSYKFGFSQLYYNKFFTEYDAENLENGISIKIKPNGWIRINIGYIYKISNAKAADAFNDPELISIIKDASYKTDVFDVSIDFPSIFSIDSSAIPFGFNVKYEHTFFQTQNEIDEYHYGREDKTIAFDTYVKHNIFKAISVKYFYNCKFRDTRSPYSNVETDKEYNLYEVGLSVNLSI